MKRPYYAPTVAGVTRFDLGLFGTAREARMTGWIAERDQNSDSNRIGTCRVFIAIEP
jgi:hypothetical protein